MPSNGNSVELLTFQSVYTFHARVSEGLQTMKANYGSHEDLFIGLEKHDYFVSFKT